MLKKVILIIAILSFTSYTSYAQSARNKADDVWDLIIDSQYDDDDLPGFEGNDFRDPRNFLRLSSQDMDLTVEHTLDTIPEGHEKYVHPIGVCARAEFKNFSPDLHPFTGMIAEGTRHCIIRLSLAADPLLDEYNPNFTPGMAMKCFVDGEVDSANFVAMPSFDGQGENYDFFSLPYTNIIRFPADPAVVALGLVFSRATTCPLWISVSEFANKTRNGYIEDEPVWPERITLEPTDVHTSTIDFRSELMDLDDRTSLWSVFGHITKDSDPIRIGSIRMRSNFVASEYCDQTLFFQHIRGEVDDCEPTQDSFENNPPGNSSNVLRAATLPLIASLLLIVAILF